EASGMGATALGAGAYATADYAAAFGWLSGSDAVNGTALGSGAWVQAAANNSVALGAQSLADRADTVSVGSVGFERQITNVADATEATDAVNLGQLEAVQTQLAQTGS